jgi:Chaperone of endosialidase
MKSSTKIRISALSLLGITLLICFALLPPKIFGVVPAPDGAYPGANTAEGHAALLSLTTGTNNTAVGWLSLRTNTTGALNTAVGAGTLASNTADENTATGAGALLSNTTGSRNTADGAFAMRSNTRGNYNTAVGTDALAFNIEGDSNTAVGDRALVFNTASENTAIGQLALFINTTGFYNTVTGAAALRSNTGGNGNSAFGWKALEDSTTGDSNTAIGAAALSNNTTGDNNVALGLNAGANVTTASNVICIGRNIAGSNEDDGCFIGNIFGQDALFGTQVFVNSVHKLGTIGSSKRFKEGIRPTGQASEALFALKPVTFRYKKEIDSGGRSQFGLLAEDVEKVNPDLIVRDKEGKPYSVRYDQVNAMLLNEFLKEHRKVQQLEEHVKKLTVGLEKVSVQIEMGQPAGTFARTNQ